MINRKAIVTMAIGDDYLNMWREKCQNGWQKYADKYGYDVICIDTPLDDSKRARERSPAWQKCLILGQKYIKKYERVVWIDADILINYNDAPCISSTVPVNKLGAVNAWALPTPELAQVALDRLNDYWGIAYEIRDHTPQDYYASYGLNADFNEVVQSGVLVLSQSHRHILEKVYFEYEEKNEGNNYEMRPLSYEILKSNCVYWIDHRFNLIWLVYKILYYPFLLDKTQPENRMLTKIRQKLFIMTPINWTAS